VIEKYGLSKAILTNTTHGIATAPYDHRTTESFCEVTRSPCS